MSLSGDPDVELPVYMTLQAPEGSITLVIDQNADLRYSIWRVEDNHTYPITFATLKEAQDYAEGWLDLIGADFREHYYSHITRPWPTGKDCSNMFALVTLLATLVLLLYLFG